MSPQWGQKTKLCVCNHSGNEPAPPSAVNSAEPTGGRGTAASGAGTAAAPEDAAYPPPAEVVAYFQRRLPRLGAPTEAGEQLLMTEVIGPRSVNGLLILVATSGLPPLLCVSQKRFSLAQSGQLAPWGPPPCLLNFRSAGPRSE